jgi:hypothetical protein
MKVHKWSELKKKHFTPAQRAAIRSKAQAELLEMDLKTLREFVGKTQVELARSSKISQAELSRAEAREDHRLTTLRRFVEALGGELEVVAHFGDTSIRLKSV